MKTTFNLSNLNIAKTKLPNLIEKRVKLFDIKPDSFERTTKTANQVVNDMGNMQFGEKVYRLFPKDLEKLKMLPENERADFLQKLHEAGRYTIENEKI